MAKSALIKKKNEKIGVKMLESALKCTECSKKTLFSKQVFFEHSKSTQGSF